MIAKENPVASCWATGSFVALTEVRALTRLIGPDLSDLVDDEGTPPEKTDQSEYPEDYVKIHVSAPVL